MEMKPTLDSFVLSRMKDADLLSREDYDSDTSFGKLQIFIRQSGSRGKNRDVGVDMPEKSVLRKGVELEKYKSYQEIVIWAVCLEWNFQTREQWKTKLEK